MKRIAGTIDLCSVTGRSPKYLPKNLRDADGLLHVSSATSLVDGDHAAVDLDANGWIGSLKQLGEELGCDRKTVYNNLGGSLSFVHRIEGGLAASCVSSLENYKVTIAPQAKKKRLDNLWRGSTRGGCSKLE